MDVEEVIMKYNIFIKGNEVRRRETVGFYSSKGQMFIIGAIFIIIALALLRNLLGIFSTAQEGESVESSVADIELRNIRSEYANIAGISTTQAVPNASAITNLYNISDFLRSDRKVKILYVMVFVNGSTQRYAVTVGNFMNDKINAQIVTSGAGSGQKDFGVVQDRTNVTEEFTPGANGTLSVMLNYTLQSSNVTEIVKASISASNHMSLFYDIALDDCKILVRSKDLYNTTW